MIGTVRYNEESASNHNKLLYFNSEARNIFGHMQSKNIVMTGHNHKRALESALINPEFLELLLKLNFVFSNKTRTVLSPCIYY